MNRGFGTGMSVVLLSVVMSIVFAACGGAARQGGVLQTPKEVEKASQAASATGDALDMSKLPEPAENSIGGIPKEDLTATPKYGGVLRTGANGWTRMDPHFASGPWPERWYSDIWNAGLVRWELKCNCPAPDLAELWTVSPDGQTYTFKLRKGVKFHNKPPVNGREVTAQDVKWSYDRLIGFDRKPGVVSINYSRFETVKSVDIVDPTTVKFVLKQADVNFLREMMYEYSKVLPKEAQIDGFFNEQKALVGAGPFMVELAQNTGLSRFVKNPDYFRKDEKGQKLPYLDEVSAFGGDVNPQLAAVTTGQLDWGLLPARLAQGLVGRTDLRFYNTRGTGVGSSGFWMNLKVKPFDDVKVRRAINLAIDRQEMTDTVFNGYMYLWGFFGSWDPYLWSDDKLKSLPGFATGEMKKAEIEEAKKLLAEAGYPNGFEFTCECENAQKADLLVAQMKRIGVKVKINAVTATVMRTTEYMKDKQFANAYMGGGHTPDYSYPAYFACSSAKNLSQLCDEDLEKTYKQYRTEPDQKQQIELLDKMQQRLWDLMPVANDGREVYYHMAYKYVRGWRNPAYDCCWGEGSQTATVWLDKENK